MGVKFNYEFDYFNSLSSLSLPLSFMPSLKLFTPFPKPRISSGIFLPPNISNTTKTMRTISQPPIKHSVILIISHLSKKYERFNRELHNVDSQLKRFCC